MQLLKAYIFLVSLLSCKYGAEVNAIWQAPGIIFCKAETV